MTCPNCQAQTQMILFRKEGKRCPACKSQPTKTPLAFCFNCKSPLYTEAEGQVCDSCYGYFNALHIEATLEDE